MKSYSEIVESIKDLPVTWYPGLLAEVVKASIANKCWLPDGATKYGATEFVRKVEADCVTVATGTPAPDLTLNRLISIRVRANP